MKPEYAAEMPRGLQLVRAGPSQTFHDLEVGHDTSTPGVKARSGPKNELRRLTSLRKVITSGEFWESLPLLSKAFLAASCIDALLVIAFSIQQMAAVCSLTPLYALPVTYQELFLHVHSIVRLQGLNCLQGTTGELLHISLVMLLTSIFFLWFAWDAIVCENAFELIASAVLGLAVCARIIFFVVGSRHLTHYTPYSTCVCCLYSLHGQAVITPQIGEHAAQCHISPAFPFTFIIQLCSRGMVQHTPYC